jgi:hypothetical protein
VLSFLPVTRDEAREIRSGAAVGARAGCGATPALRAALGEDTSLEEAEFAGLSLAGVMALGVGADALRLVLAVDTEAAQVEDAHSEYGELSVTGLRWSQVQALFGDEPAAAPAVARARAAMGGLSLADALAVPEVDALGEFDLLWFAVEELDELP